LGRQGKKWRCGGKNQEIGVDGYECANFKYADGWIIRSGYTIQKTLSSINTSNILV
jgi:hypothetical protein